MLRSTKKQTFIHAHILPGLCCLWTRINKIEKDIRVTCIQYTYMYISYISKGSNKAQVIGAITSRYNHLHQWLINNFTTGSPLAGTSDHRLAFSPIFAHLCHSNGRKRFSLVLLVVVLLFHLKTRWSEFSQLALPCFVVKNALDIIRTESAANAEVVRHHLFESLQYTMGPLETCRLVLPALPLGKQCQIEDQNVCAPFFSTVKRPKRLSS